jgi:hypothetical protein
MFKFTTEDTVAATEIAVLCDAEDYMPEIMLDGFSGFIK